MLGLRHLALLLATLLVGCGAGEAALDAGRRDAAGEDGPLDAGPARVADGGPHPDASRGSDGGAADAGPRALAAVDIYLGRVGQRLGGPRVVRGVGGLLYVVFIDETRLVVMPFDPETGRQWPVERPPGLALGRSFGPSAFLAEADPNGDLVILLRDPGTRELSVHRRRADTGRYSEPVVLGEATTDVLVPGFSVAVGDGEVTVAFEAWGGGGIQIARADPTWAPTYPMLAAEEATTALLTQTDGGPYVVWDDVSGWVGADLPGPGERIEGEPLETGRISTPVLTATGSGDILGAWFRSAGEEATLRVASGPPFGPSVQVFPEDGPLDLSTTLVSGLPALVSSGLRALLLLRVRDVVDGSSAVWRVLRDPGGEWTAPLRLDGGNGNELAVALGVGDDLAFALVDLQPSIGSTIRIHRRRNGEWSEAQVGNPGGGVGNLHVLMTPEGAVDVLWASSPFTLDGVALQWARWD
jgi:hypothetical protein